MSAPNPGNRPTSPHPRPTSPFMFGSLYRWQISSVTSMIHRFTGVALFFSFLMLVLWVASAAKGGAYFGAMQWLLTSWAGKLALLLSLWGLCYHFLNGIRHLFWDMGKGFDLNVAAKTGMFVIIGSVVLTIIILILL